jgi:hypothetical protein
MSSEITAGKLFTDTLPSTPSNRPIVISSCRSCPTIDVQGRAQRNKAQTSYVSSNADPLSPASPQPKLTQVVHHEATGHTSTVPLPPPPPLELRRFPSTFANTMDRRALSTVSWYTRHHYLSRPRAIAIGSGIFASLCALVWIICAVGQDPNECQPTEGYTGAATYMCIVFSVSEAIAIVILSIKLSRHSRDSLGLKAELRSAAVLVLICVFIGYTTVVVALGMDDYWPVVVSIVGFCIWITSTIYPLCLMVRHNRRQGSHRFHSFNRDIDQLLMYAHIRLINCLYVVYICIIAKLLNDVQTFSSLVDFLQVFSLLPNASPFLCVFSKSLVHRFPKHAKLSHNLLLQSFQVNLLR